MAKVVLRSRRAQVFDLERLSILVYKTKGYRISRDEFKNHIKYYPSTVSFIDDTVLTGYLVTAQFSPTTLLIKDFHHNSYEELVLLLSDVLTQSIESGYRAIYSLGNSTDQPLPGFKWLHSVGDTTLYVKEL